MTGTAMIEDRDVVVGIDTGGTFTDVTLLEASTGRLWTAKTPSTPEDPSIAFAEGLGMILLKAGAGGPSVKRVLHATTVATNLILEQKGPRTGMLVTDGFKYVNEIGRQDVPRGKNLYSWVKPKRPLRPRHIWEIRQRMAPDGVVLEPLDEAAVREAAASLRKAGLFAISIVFLHSYANPAHERRAAELLAEEYPEALVTVSSDVMPVFREYERGMTANFNAYVMPAVSSYVARLEARVEAAGIGAPLLLMKSSGGVASARAVRRRPVETALSGPSAGIVGAGFIGESVGIDRLICIDIGGTSADISLVQRGQPELTERGAIGDWPIGLPIVNVTTIGAGGGSIARVSGAGLMTVGPESAGARPGPVCYCRGGIEPTVTDAHLVLGHLPPYLLDGSYELDLDGARQAIHDRIAVPLGKTVEEAAAGILEIADSNMIGAIRLVSVERGFDPRDCVLMPFGGAGPLHGCAIARAMGIRTVIVPPSPGVLSALGLLVSDLKAEFSTTSLQKAGAFELDRLAQDFAELRDQAALWFAEEEIPPTSRQLQLLASMRYQSQGHELTVVWPGTAVDEAALVGAVEAFHQLHERVYSFAQRDTPIEITNLRVDARGVFPRLALADAPDFGPPNEAISGQIELTLPKGKVLAQIYDRRKLGQGAALNGPCVITQLDATTYILPGQIATVHRNGSLIVTDTTLE